MNINIFCLFNFQDSDTTSYYAIFDGHGGTDAAAYSVSHLHCEIAASKYYPNEPHEALREAFLSTDDKFIKKSEKQVRHLQLWPFQLRQIHAKENSPAF